MPESITHATTSNMPSDAPPGIPDDSAGEQARITVIEAPVVEVTVLEDRAHVVRRARIELPAGTSRLRIDGVAPVLADKTLCAALVPPAGDGGRGQGEPDSEIDAERARVSDARVHRRRLIMNEDRPEERRALMVELERLQDEHTRQRARLEQIRSQQASLEGVAEATVVDMAVDVSHGRTEPETWQRVLEQLGDSEWALRRKRVDAEHAIAELNRDIENLRRRLAATERTSDRLVAEAMIEVWTAAGGSYDLRVDYVVPGACWRPYHRAHLPEQPADGDRDGASDTRTVHFTSEGCVWQNTGEDWTDVRLVFSTERLSLGLEPPRLTMDLLLVQRKSDAVVVEAREQEVQTTGLGAGPRQQRAPELPGIDDGGEALHLEAPEQATVPSDGRPYRIPLMQFTASATTRHVLMPELATAVILESTQTNQARQPILAGPVDLVRGGGFAGRTSVLFVAPGERFALGWGPDGAIRVQRSLERSKDERGIMSAWTSQGHRVRVRISNLGREPRTIHVTERVPVSEIEKLAIEVNAASTTGKRKPDEHGFVRWTVELPAHGHESVELHYIVKKHGDVVGI